MTMISYSDFEKVEIRVGTILSATEFPEARNPSYKLEIDFGSFGIKKSSAQITVFYSKEELVGKQIVAVINFPVKQIANYFSECLVLGVVGDDKVITLLHPETKVENGLRIL
ncbi:MAG: tRNA-binding protein [Saprospiraceae bacterium]|nr:tRNA-binding protein [Saprospiraceae bacterium]